METIRDYNVLGSAVDAPSIGHVGGYFHTNLFAMAAAMTYGLARNHPFIDGNKRTAFMCCTIFLQMNGVVTTLTNRQCTELMVAVADRKVTMTQLEATLRKKSTPRKFTGTFCGRAKGISS